jgi:hypothetical protein
VGIGPTIRTVLILGGLAGGAALGYIGGSQPVPETATQQQAQAAAPVVLNTAAPLEAPHLPLSSPLSLESAFGRSELTGAQVDRVAANPLHELSFDRRWDVVLEMRPPKPGAELPPEPASDEVAEPEPDTAAVEDTYDFKHLPADARARALEGLKALRDGTEVLRQGEQEFRRRGSEGAEGRQKIRNAAVMLRDAITKFEVALRAAPNDRELLDLIQDAKANLYFCMKHGM